MGHSRDAAIREGMQDAEPRPARHFNICGDATRQHRTNIRASDLERLAFSCKRGKRCICSDRPDPVLRSLATPLYPNGLGGHRSDGVRTALSSGARIGALIGVLAVVNNSVEVFRSSCTVPAILGVSISG